jgi:hypothetical protein
VFVLLGCQIKVVETSLWLIDILPSNREVGNKLLSQTNTSTRVGREVDSRDAELSCKL